MRREIKPGESIDGEAEERAAIETEKLFGDGGRQTVSLTRGRQHQPDPHFGDDSGDGDQFVSELSERSAGSVVGASTRATAAINRRRTVSCPA